MCSMVSTQAINPLTAWCKSLPSEDFHDNSADSYLQHSQQCPLISSQGVYSLSPENFRHFTNRFQREKLRSHLHGGFPQDVTVKFFWNLFSQVYARKLGRKFNHISYVTLAILFYTLGYKYIFILTDLSFDL